MNLASWLLLSLVIVCFAAALRWLVKHKGACHCSGDCTKCPCCNKQKKT